mgnify:CR=1 FL=1
MHLAVTQPGAKQFGPAGQQPQRIADAGGGPALHVRRVHAARAGGGLQQQREQIASARSRWIENDDTMAMLALTVWPIGTHWSLLMMS